MISLELGLGIASTVIAMVTFLYAARINRKYGKNYSVEPHYPSVYLASKDSNIYKDFVRKEYKNNFFALNVYSETILREDELNQVQLIDYEKIEQKKIKENRRLIIIINETKKDFEITNIITTDGLPYRNKNPIYIFNKMACLIQYDLMMLKNDIEKIEITSDGIKCVYTIRGKRKHCSLEPKVKYK